MPSRWSLKHLTLSRLGPGTAPGVEKVDIVYMPRAREEVRGLNVRV